MNCTRPELGYYWVCSNPLAANLTYTLVSPYTPQPQAEATPTNPLLWYLCHFFIATFLVISDAHFEHDERAQEFVRRLVLTTSNLVLTTSTWQHPLQSVLSLQFVVAYGQNYCVSFLLSLVLFICWELLAITVSAMYQRLTGPDERPSELKSRLPVPLDGKC